MSIRQNFAEHPQFVPGWFDEFLEFLAARLSGEDYDTALELLHRSVNPMASARRHRVQADCLSMTTHSTERKI